MVAGIASFPRSRHGHEGEHVDGDLIDDAVAIVVDAVTGLQGYGSAAAAGVQFGCVFVDQPVAIIIATVTAFWFAQVVCFTS